MYSESDIAGAVEAGVMTPEAAAKFRHFIAADRSAPAVDEEHFRLLTGFNDIFVAIASMLILVAAGRIGAWFGGTIIGVDNMQHEVGASVAGGGFTVAMVSWLLAEYFTRKRRMALPSILLLLGFIWGVAGGVLGLFGANALWLAEQFHIANNQTGIQQIAGASAAVAGIVTAAAAWAHWKRFMVPITVAAGVTAVVGLGIALIMAWIPDARSWFNPILLVAGLAVFALAMRWDLSDRERRTRRSDVAFWLHLAAAPMIAHPIFHMLGVFGGNMQAPTAVLVLGLYIVFAIVALAVDRRALLVSSLIYVLWAMYALFEATHAVELSAALTGLVIGSALLLLSAFWHVMRRGVVGLLGSLGESLPPTQQPVLA
jgi:MFS family permease